MTFRTGATARRAARIGAALLLAAGSFAAPGLARDTTPGQPALGGGQAFADSFASYATTPATPQVSAGAADGSALPAVAAPAPAEVSDAGQDLGAGLASWYGPGLAGHNTASGERFDPSELTAAHRSLPFGSHVRVTNESNGRSVVVRINDRGPWAHGRVIDLSEAAARQLGLVGAGESEVSLALLSD